MTTNTMPRAAAFDRKTAQRIADWLAVAVAVSLPWSTTATGVLIVPWLIAVLVALDGAAIRRELTTAAGGLPVALCLLAALGMLWADVPWRERLNGFDSFIHLLLLPLVLAQFRGSARGAWVLYGFLASVCAVLLVSWALALLPGLAWRGKTLGVPVKDYIFQSASFLICAFVLLERAIVAGRSRNWGMAAACTGVAVLFLADIFFVVTGRTTLLVAPVLALLLGWRHFGWRGVLAACVIGSLAGAAVYLESPYLRGRLNTSIADLQAYRGSDAVNPTALHLEFLRKSWQFVVAAPIIGHGTGSIDALFREAAAGQTGAAGVTSTNPHNQIFAVAIQLGLIGAALLVAMWAAHLMLFRGATFTEWIGMVVVVENIVSSTVNSHLFDFTQGWLYVFGVGVVGGMILRQRSGQGELAPA